MSFIKFLIVMRRLSIVVVFLLSMTITACSYTKDTSAQKSDVISEDVADHNDYVTGSADISVSISEMQCYNNVETDSVQESEPTSMDISEPVQSVSNTSASRSTKATAKTNAAYDEGYDDGYEDGCNRERNESFAPKTRKNSYYSDYCQGYADGYYDGYMDTVEDYAVDGIEEDDDEDWEEE